MLLAEHGFGVFGVDIDVAAVRDVARRARARGFTIRAWAADLTDYPLGTNRFDLILVTRYLDRRIFGALKNALVPGGVIVYETFTAAQRALGRGPRSPDHLLEPGELRKRFDDFEVIYSCEVDSPEAVARVVAIKP
jgi:SAM-dependent methyltransferase